MCNAWNHPLGCTCGWGGEGHLGGGGNRWTSYDSGFSVIKASHKISDIKHEELEGSEAIGQKELPEKVSYTLKLPRLLGAAKEFNIGQDILIEFLVGKGFDRDELKPTAKLSLEMYETLVSNFQGDGRVKSMLPEKEKLESAETTDKKELSENSFYNPKSIVKSILHKEEEPESLEAIIRKELPEKVSYTLKLPRLLGAAKEFNIRQDILIEFLVGKGFDRDELKPTAKLSLEMYEAVVSNFQGDGRVKSRLHKEEKEERKEKPLKEKRIKVLYGDIGYGYETLFKEYMVGATEITLEDAYIRQKHQISNFIRLCEIIVKVGNCKKLTLITGADNTSQKKKNILAFDQITNSLFEYKIEFRTEFSDVLHDRELKMNNGWSIKMGRGLDYFQSLSGNYFQVGTNDLDLRRCLETSFDFYKP